MNIVQFSEFTYFYLDLYVHDTTLKCSFCFTEMVKISICVSFLLVVGARSEWSWGKNSQAAIDKPVSAEKITELEATPEAKTDIAVGRSLDVSGVSGAPNVPGSGFGGVSGLPGNSNFHGVSGHSNFQADLNIPNGAVLPLEEHSSYSSVPKLKENTEEGVLSEQEEGRSGRFLGISEKLCKLGVKGMVSQTLEIFLFYFNTSKF